MNDCNRQTTLHWINGTVTLMVGVVLPSIGAAIALNYYPWTTWAAVGSLLFSAAMCALANHFFLQEALEAAEEFFECSSAKKCSGAMQNFRRNLRAVQVDLGILQTSCLTAAAASVLPFLGEPFIKIALGGGIVLLALMISLIVLWKKLLSCIDNQKPSTTNQTGSPIATLIVELDERDRSRIYIKKAD